METIFSTRFVMSGWIFVGLLVGSIWQCQGASWAYFLGLIGHGAQDGSATAALLGILVGVSGPPALGFLFERLTGLLTRAFGTNLWRHPKASYITDQLERQINIQPPAIKQQLDVQPAAYLIVLLYSYAEPGFLEWTRRRTASHYASITSIIAIVAAIAASYVLGAFSWPFVIIGAVAGVILGFNAWFSGQEQNEAVTAWADIAAPFAIAKMTQPKQ